MHSKHLWRSGVRRIKLLALARLHRDVPLRRFGFFPLVHALIARVPERDRLLSMQQCAGLRHVVDVGGRRHDRVHQTRFSMDADVRFHATGPLLTLLRLMRLRVARGSQGSSRRCGIGWAQAARVFPRLDGCWFIRGSS